jgi:hypothetical protein
MMMYTKVGRWYVWMKPVGWWIVTDWEPTKANRLENFEKLRGVKRYPLLSEAVEAAKKMD